TGAHLAPVFFWSRYSSFLGRARVLRVARRRTSLFHRASARPRFVESKRRQPTSRVGNLNDRHASATSTIVTRRQRLPTSRGVNVNPRHAASTSRAVNESRVMARAHHAPARPNARVPSRSREWSAWLSPSHPVLDASRAAPTYRARGANSRDVPLD